jgi:hypothetical protein
MRRLQPIVSGPCLKDDMGLRKQDREGLFLEVGVSGPSGRVVRDPPDSWDGGPRIMIGAL